MDISGKAQEWASTEPLESKLDTHLTYSFLCVPELGATIHLTGDKLETGLPLDKEQRW